MNGYSMDALKPVYEAPAIPLCLLNPCLGEMSVSLDLVGLLKKHSLRIFRLKVQVGGLVVDFDLGPRFGDVVSGNPNSSQFFLILEKLVLGFPATQVRMVS